MIFNFDVRAINFTMLATLCIKGLTSDK